MHIKSNAYSYQRVDIDNQNRMPFPLVTAGIGLLLSYIFPGGLSGGQGFLIGFAVGVLVPGVITLYIIGVKARRDQLAKIEMEFSKLQTRLTNRHKI
ncbi:MAG: hypothetical protein ACREA2_11395 [Blastocatellia bacterium]